MTERSACANVMEPREETADLHQLRVRHLVENTSTYLRKYRVEDPGIADLTKGFAVR